MFTTSGYETRKKGLCLKNKIRMLWLRVHMAKVEENCLNLLQVPYPKIIE